MELKSILLNTNDFIVRACRVIKDCMTDSFDLLLERDE